MMTRNEDGQQLQRVRSVESLPMRRDHLGSTRQRGHPMRRLNRRTSLLAIGLLGALGNACGSTDTPHRASATPITACVGPLGLGFVVNSQLDVVSITPGTLPTTMGLAVGDRIVAILGAPVATAGEAQRLLRNPPCPPKEAAALLTVLRAGRTIDLVPQPPPQTPLRWNGQTPTPLPPGKGYVLL